MAVIITKKTNTQTKADYIKQVRKYAEVNGLHNASIIIDSAVEDGLNQIYNLVANESPIECVDYDFKNTQVRSVALWIDDNFADIASALEAAGNLKIDEDEDEDEDGCSDSNEVTTDVIMSLIGETLGLIKKEINAKSDLEKAEVVTGTNALLEKMLKIFAQEYITYIIALDFSK